MPQAKISPAARRSPRSCRRDRSLSFWAGAARRASCFSQRDIGGCWRDRAVRYVNTDWVSDDCDMVRTRRRYLWAALLLLVFLPTAIFGLQALLHGHRPSLSTTIPTPPLPTIPTPMPTGATPAVTLAAPVPSPREGDAMAYDDVRNEVVMFGGAGFGSGPQPANAETWTFDSRGWHRLRPTRSPDVNNDALMAEDPVSHTLVLVGGAFTPNNHSVETWTWDGHTWTQQSSLPTSNENPYGLAPLSSLGQLVLLTWPQSAAVATMHTWTWTGSGWLLRHPGTNLPVGGAAPVLAADPAHHRVIALFSATPDAGTETWAWDGSTWSRVPATNSPPYTPISGTMTPDPRTGDVVLYLGGGDVLVGSTWTLNGSTWKEVDARSPAIDTDYHGCWLLTDTRVRTVLVIGNSGRPNPLNALWVFTGSGWYAHNSSALSS